MCLVKLIITHQILKLAGMFYASYNDIWLNSPIKCHGTLYYGACTSISAQRILRCDHEFLMPKLYMHTLLKSSPLLKNYAIIKVFLGLPSAQSNIVFRRTHKTAIIPPWGWSGFCVPSVFPFHFNLFAMILQQIFLLFLSRGWKILLVFSQTQLQRLYSLYKNLMFIEDAMKLCINSNIFNLW